MFVPKLNYCEFKTEQKVEKATVDRTCKFLSLCVCVYGSTEFRKNKRGDDMSCHHRVEFFARKNASEQEKRMKDRRTSKRFTLHNIDCKVPSFENYILITIRAQRALRRTDKSYVSRVSRHARS